jgi:hypothetical protein
MSRNAFATLLIAGLVMAAPAAPALAAGPALTAQAPATPRANPE